MKAHALLLLAACGSSGSPAPDGGSNPTYTPTPQGMPAGTPTTMTIDSAGGTLASADGRLDVAIPAGALASPTAVTIQPITNNSPNGLGLAYRLSPEGTTFATPATLTFHLDDAQAMAVDTTFITTQAGDGTWWSQPMQARTANTVSVPAPHFSDWAASTLVTLSPQDVRVRTGMTATFDAFVLATADDDLLADPYTGQIEVPDPSLPSGAVEWAVNAVVGGNDTIGHIASSADDVAVGHYGAPAATPSPATVAVSVSLQHGSTKAIGVAEVTIVSLESWSGTSTITGAGGVAVSATFTFIEDPAQSSGGTYRFTVMTGTVTATPPPPSGCTLVVTPITHDIAANEGMMTVVYASPLDFDGDVSGEGDSVWLATYTETCPSGTGSMMSGLQGEWWPLGAGGMPVTENSVDGIVDFDIAGGTASGHVHLARQ